MASAAAVSKGAAVSTAVATPAQIEQEIQRTMRSLTHTLGRLEAELGRLGGAVRSDLLWAVGRELGRTAVVKTVRRRPLLTVVGAAALGVAASWALRSRSRIGATEPAELDRAKTAPLPRWSALSAVALGALLEQGAASLRRAGRLG